ncbi:bifunctional [glutamate--ammonia ligase]-adenylyl-L-tyrosine phosphorylase/[glutamate--ammonia-ligase] adenylyltransferase [Pseudoxanthomonas dokdonensis]|uniref:Bifunctional glutamine synthetase adenylyltransferase/adenylyl-removing enzyme n=1 Tax=Pseudoxanthomonas dokdonensis TaxID=344882 RepID=A0A0R0CRF8_9GAMM|nr:bifunctional [glutamate--ammonia ligase]-adenylyl-L-tyrosine phosphorylase/[glutamate--ammonia-ligase] adenylyltransferase [Pseudoxanthomonas dokdonensis]KRG68615.1 glutamate-ammonia-ligase adenylyltransferase [Pseudoxanthomonas dokdonensis]
MDTSHDPTDSTIASDLDALIERGLSRLQAASPALARALQQAQARDRVRTLLQASDFALETLCRQPQYLEQWLTDDGATAVPLPVLQAGQSEQWPGQLRRYRTAESSRLIWRDVHGLDSVDDTLRGSTRLAETCLQTALDALENDFASRHGVVRDGDGQAQRLIVFGLGKLGGGELNFSSDVDLVYAYPHGGQSDGARTLMAEDYFARLGQRLAKLLDEVTVDGFCHRVDLRLRPFGSAGRVALSLAGMDAYFQREGRDWERYAWLKARTVAGDIEAGEQWLQTLRPFVYRRYLDFTALDGLREMKAAITAEVARRELADDIKRGAGGIREIEFLVQALQLIRGGREETLRERRLLPALRALVELNQVAAEEGDALAASYRYLRRVENRLQMLRDAQTHVLPDSPLDRLRLARGLGHADWTGLRAQIDGVRAHVAGEFAALLAPRKPGMAKTDLAQYWRSLPDDGDAQALADAGFESPLQVDAALREFARFSAVDALSDSARARLDRVLPAVLTAAAACAKPDAALKRVLALLQAILRRTSYLALLDEQPSALTRLVDVLARSALLAERLAAYPLLLDEMLDSRVGGPMPDRALMHEECTAALREEDPEQALRALNETRLALSFRVALAALDQRQSALDSTRQLAWLADEVVKAVLQMACDEVSSAHGIVGDGRFAIIGYGSLGGQELGFGSDLDLVFVFDAPVNAQSDGKRPLEAGRWYARLAQKMMALLGAVTSAGRLYDVDVRLRPDGAKGLLVSSLASFREYQRERAWTWEHQALVRARGVAGNDALLGEIEQIRRDALARPRQQQQLAGEVGDMRARMRNELDRSRGEQFDLKQGAGGLVDLEFLLQYLALRDASRQPLWLAPRDTPGLLVVARQQQALPDADIDALVQAHATLVAAGLGCTLDRRPRIVTVEDDIIHARQAIEAAVLRVGLVYQRLIKSPDSTEPPLP